MAEVSTWSLFAYMDGDAGHNDEHRLLTEWQLQDALRWCVTRGFDNIYLARLEEPAQFVKADPVPGITHHH